MRVYKPSGIKWLGEIPQSWEIKPLQAIFNQRNEQNNNLEFQTILSLVKDVGVIPYEEKGNVGNKAKDDLQGYKIARVNDLVLNKMNAVIGSLGVSKYDGLVSPIYLVLYIENPNYLIAYYSYLFQTKSIQKFLRKFAYGIMEIRESIDYLEFKKMFLPTPPLQEQKEIAEFLDKKCEKIQNYINKKQKLITLLQEKKQALINEAVTKGLNPNIESKNSGIAYLGLIPHHWEVKKLKYLATLRNQKSNDSDFKVGLENIESQTGKYISTNEVVFEDSGIYFYKNDILFGKLRPYLAKVFLADREGVCVSEFLVLTPKKQCGNFLKFLMLSPLFISVVDGSTYGSKMPRASWEFIGNLKIPLPPLHEQKEIAAFLDSKVAQIDLVIEKTKKQIELVKEYKNTLINEAVCGRINLERK
ncbi:restriction endonuclease subunit S [Campylobacter upsaliensis]|nr:restriction endonuclease subunit S [Campylobacter upsaliensis]EAJ8484837.1 restriction endonuclease subunit S [Campylobacter upsaliensis]